MKKILLPVSALALVAGCTWVKLEDAGSHVRVAYDGRVGGCERVGEVSVSVKDRVGLYERNDLKVKDELETLARNEAAGMPADTLVAKKEPRNGAQAFDAYRCGAGRRSAERENPPPAQPARGGEAETFPVR